jgi:hypothetical protein
MADMSPGTGSKARDRMIFAIILIVVGAVGLASQYLDLSEQTGGWIVLLIGLGLLGAFVYTQRQYGYLIPGGIMTGLGIGIVASEALTFPSDEVASGAIVLGLGFGFLSIWVVGMLLRVERSHWWPLIPGGILAAVGAALLIGGQAVKVLDYWGVVIIAIGIVVLWRGFAERRGRG